MSEKPQNFLLASRSYLYLSKEYWAHSGGRQQLLREASRSQNRWILQIVDSICNCDGFYIIYLLRLSIGNIPKKRWTNKCEKLRLLIIGVYASTLASLDFFPLSGNIPMMMFYTHCVWLSVCCRACLWKLLLFSENRNSLKLLFSTFESWQKIVRIWNLVFVQIVEFKKRCFKNKRRWPKNLYMYIREDINWKKKRFLSGIARIT